MLSTVTLISFVYRLLIIQGVSTAIKITRLEVPTPLAVGDSGWLECEWADEGDHVYTLKWYLGIDEFYRWTPLETPSVKVFPTQHFNVDTQSSQRGRVKIRNVTVDAGGNYRCEVSGEAPVFKTSFRSAIMTVVDVPDDRPIISSKGRGPYRLQEQVTFTCSSHDAKPAPHLTFYINDQPVDPTWEEDEHIFLNDTTSLETVEKTLKFRLRPTMVQLGVLTVKCVASYPDLYWESSESAFTVDQPYDSVYGHNGFVIIGGVSRPVGSSHLLYSLLLLLLLATFLL
ncbi:uncharacterized protein LOC121863504 [Homarus americanus]|uniref:uncharacterized protein LOC121863504 n=1 Tax=Homarus americanus TaxID=6706 RepID=UPI001C45C33A|nr:uncharacterized protein LOC121863504 [Homarus americanus]